MKTKANISNLLGHSDFKKTLESSGITQYLKKLTDDFGCGFLVGKIRRERDVSVQVGLINHPMWELQQCIEGTREVKIPFLLYSEVLTPSISADGKQEIVDNDALLKSIDSAIKFYLGNEESLLNDLVDSLRQFKHPNHFTQKCNHFLKGFDSYYGLLYKHLYVTKVNEPEVDAHIQRLKEDGLSDQAVCIFRLGLMKGYLANLH